MRLVDHIQNRILSVKILYQRSHFFRTKLKLIHLTRTFSQSSLISCPHLVQGQKVRLQRHEWEGTLDRGPGRREQARCQDRPELTQDLPCPHEPSPLQEAQAALTLNVR